MVSFIFPESAKGFGHKVFVFPVVTFFVFTFEGIGLSMVNSESCMLT